MSVFASAQFVKAARLAYDAPGEAAQVPMILRYAEVFNVDYAGAVGKVFIDHDQRILAITIAGSSTLQHAVDDASLFFIKQGRMRFSSGVWRYCLGFSRGLLKLLAQHEDIQRIDPDTYRVVILGHSLGGSASIILPFAMRQVLAEEVDKKTLDPEIAKQVITCFADPEVFTYGAMRVLDRPTAAAYPWRATHVEVEGDVAALWPPRILGYCHPGKTIILRKSGKLAVWSWTFNHFAAALKSFFLRPEQANAVSAHSCFTYELLMQPFLFRTVEWHLGLRSIE